MAAYALRRLMELNACPREASGMSLMGGTPIGRKTLRVSATRLLRTASVEAFWSPKSQAVG